MSKLLLILLFIISCTKEYGPKESLETFINLRFKSVDSREKYTSLLVGDYKTSFESMTDEQFNKYIDMSKYKKKRFKIVTQRCVESKCMITYIISYDVLKNGEVSFVSDVKKMATIIKKPDEKSWKIKEVVNLKTHYDSKNPLTP